MSRRKLLTAMFPKHFALAAFALALFSVNCQASLVTSVAADQVFNNDTTVTAGDFGSAFNVVNRTAHGSSSYTIDYEFIADLAACGGTGTASTNFSVTFTTSDGVIPNQGTIGVDGAADATNNIDSGESVTATISNFTASTLFPAINFGSIQSYGPGDMNVNGTTMTNNNPVFLVNDTSFTISNVDRGSDVGAIGFIQYRVDIDCCSTAIPEPCGLLLFCTGISSFLLGRRRQR